jgi:SAM-dependent methyltransferase
VKQALDIDYRHADAESLPFSDRFFDGVISTFGVMFVGKPEAAAAELARVIRPGGRVVLATWKHDGAVFEMFGVMRQFMPAPPQPPPPSPFAWGKHERLNELLGADFELEFEEGASIYRYASSRQAWDLFVNHYGPTKTLAASLDDGRRRARARLRRLARDVQEGPRLRAAARVRHHARQAPLSCPHRE